MQMAPDSRRRHCLVNNVIPLTFNIVFHFAPKGVASRVYEHIALPLENIGFDLNCGRLNR